MLEQNNEAFEGNALTNRSPFNYFWVQQNFWAITGVWSGKRAQKGPIKKTTSWCQQNGQYLCKKLPTRFSTISPKKLKLLFGHWYLFYRKNLSRKEYQILENLFLPKIFHDFKNQIGGLHFFIIWQDGQMPRSLFFTNVYPNGPTRNQSILGSQIKKNIYLLQYAKTAILLWKTSKTFVLAP